MGRVNLAVSARVLRTKTKKGHQLFEGKSANPGENPGYVCDFNRWIQVRYGCEVCHLPKIAEIGYCECFEMDIFGGCWVLRISFHSLSRQTNC